MKVIKLVRIAFATAALAACSGPSPGATHPPARLTVFAAASLTDAFKDLGRRFEADHPGVTVAFSFAGSQQLAQQLAEGAPADVFASANSQEMENAVAAGRVAAGAPRTFARNRLVIVAPRADPPRIQDPAGLADPGLLLVLAAKEVPVGRYTLTFLERADASGLYGADYAARVLANVVSYEQNVKSVLNKVALGEADAGVVYTSDVSGEAAGRVIQIPIPDALNVAASYPIAALSDGPAPELAQAFVDYVLSAAGQEVLAGYGFLPAAP